MSLGWFGCEQIWISGFADHFLVDIARFPGLDLTVDLSRILVVVFQFLYVMKWSCMMMMKDPSKSLEQALDGLSLPSGIKFQKVRTILFPILDSKIWD